MKQTSQHKEDLSHIFPEAIMNLTNILNKVKRDKHELGLSNE